MHPSPGRLVVLACLAPTASAPAADWPAWRYDAQRTGASPHDLPADLKLHWTLTLPTITPAWPDQPLIPFDAAYEPIVVGQLMVIGSPRTDSVTAYDSRTGAQRWRFLADGPIRFAPCHHAGKLYVSSDDGHLYCLALATGDLKWQFRGGPDGRKVLGNNQPRLGLAGPRGPVVADGVVYFAASIWPFMGVFIHALDADTGKVIWTNDGDGSMYVKQPHSADSFAGVAPQGPMTIAGDLLFVPGGRSVPAAYDRKTGKLRHYLLNDNSKKGGGHTVVAAGALFFNGPGVFRTTTGKHLGESSPVVVATGNEVHAFQAGEVRTLDVTDALPDPNAAKAKWKPDIVGAVKAPGATTLMRAGSRLYVGRLAAVEALQLPLPVNPPSRPAFAWRADIDGLPVSLVAADDRLFISTSEDRIYCFGPGDPPAPAVEARAPSADTSTIARHLSKRRASLRLRRRLTADVSLIAALARETKLSSLRLIRRESAKAARSSDRRRPVRRPCVVHARRPGSFPLPAYCGLLHADAVEPAALPRVYESLGRMAEAHLPLP